MLQLDRVALLQLQDPSLVLLHLPRHLLLTRLLQLLQLRCMAATEPVKLLPEGDGGTESVKILTMYAWKHFILTTRLKPTGMSECSLLEILVNKSLGTMMSFQRTAVERDFAKFASYGASYLCPAPRT